MRTTAGRASKGAAASAKLPPRRHRRIRLDEGKVQHFFLFGEINGPDASRKSVEQLARNITAKHPLFGKVDLNGQTYASFIKNFNEGTYGQDIYLDRNHDISQGVQGKITKLFSRDGKLFAEIDWTEKGVQTFQQDGFKYFSIDFTDDYINPETGKNHGPLLFGAALTPRPFIKNMKPSDGPGRLTLSEGRTIFVPDYLQLKEDADMKGWLKKLRAKLLSMNLSEQLVSILMGQAEVGAKLLGDLAEEDPKLAQLAIAVESDAKKLQDHFDAERSAHHSGGFELTEDELSDAIGKALKLRDDASQKSATDLATNRKTFTDMIDSEKGLTESTRKLLKEQVEAINAGMSEDQVKRLATSAVKLGNDMEVRSKKLMLGMAPAGSLNVVEIIDSVGSSVHGLLRDKLKLTDAFSAGSLRLKEEKDLSPFARKVLAQFDRIHGYQLEQEHKLLAGDGSTVIADGAFPVVAQRQVIVELLADLKFLALIATVVDPNAQATMQIPYEVRNLGNVVNGAIVYEGKPINRAGVSQRMDTSFIVPRKIALLISNEMIHFSRVAQINWDAWGRNIASNVRLMRDLVCAAIANTLQRTADSFGALSIVDEVLTAQVDGTRTVFKTVQFPVVRQYMPRKLDGTSAGATENPQTLKIATVAKAEYDGTGTQAAGNYYQWTDMNMGFFRIVNELGVVQTLVAATVLTLSYDYATNVQKFSTDVPGGVDADFYYNGLLDAFGDRKAVLQQQRFVMAQFGISSWTLNNLITKARRFAVQNKKNGTDTNAEGDLDIIKGVPQWSTDQPGVDLGDTRILLGERNTLTYGIAKPFVTGTPFEAVDPTTGRPTGEKIAYGEEYSTIHVPVPIRNRLTSVIAYSVIARAAA